PQRPAKGAGPEEEDIGRCYTREKLSEDRVMPLSREEVLHVAKLARVGLSEDDVVKFQGQLSQILDHFEELKRIPTEGVEPTTHTLSAQSVAAADEPAPSLPQDAALANAPAEQDGYLRVRAVLEE